MPKTAATTWGRQVRKRREELDLTQAEVAERSGITQQNISRIELDKVTTPRYRTLKRLAEVLQTTVEELDP